MTAVEEMEEIKIDVDLDHNIEWEVETEPAPAPADTAMYPEDDRDDPGIRAARSYNKHLFVWVFSFVCGMYGVDRFVRGQTALGVFKILTLGGLGCWYLIDLIIALVKAYSGEYRDMEDLLFDEYGRYIY